MIGDGGFVFALEKRGYVKAGPWTPEATVENPEAGNVHTYAFIYFIVYLYSAQYLHILQDSKRYVTNLTAQVQP